MDKFSFSFLVEKPNMEEIFSYVTQQEMLLLYLKGIDFLPLDVYKNGNDLYVKFLKEIDKVGKLVANREGDPDFDHLAIIFNTYVRDALISINKSWYNTKGIPNDTHYIIYIHDMLPRILRQMYISFFIDPTNKYLYSYLDDRSAYDWILDAEIEKEKFLDDEKDSKIDLIRSVIETSYKQIQVEANDSYLCPSYSRFLKNAEKIGKVFNYFIYLNHINNSILAQECASLMD